MFSGDDADAELGERTAEEQRIAASLYELDNHAGHQLLRTGPLSGATAQRWTNGRETLDRLWHDFALYRDTVAAARTARGGRARPDPGTLAELDRLLHQPCIEVGRTPVGLSERGLTGPAERVEHVTLSELRMRMSAAFDQVSTLITRCGQLHADAMAVLGQLAERRDAARRLAGDLGLSVPELDRVDQALTELERRASADPLALEPPDDSGRPGLDARLTEQPAAVLDRVQVRLAELSAVRDQWSTRMTELDAELTGLAEAHRAAMAAHHDAAELTDAKLDPPADPLPALRTRRAEVDRLPDWSRRTDELRRLRTELDAAASSLAEAEALAVGLVERRAELRGRFEGYRARAVRLGLVEDAELVELEQRIRRLLWTRPAELAAATRAVARYQQLVRARDGRPR